MVRLIDVDSLEMAEILLFLAKQYGISKDEMDDQKHGICGVMCINNYMTDGPGYTGDLYIISWRGAPEFITVVGRHGNKNYSTCGTLTLIGNLGQCGCHWDKGKEMNNDEKFNDACIRS